MAKTNPETIKYAHNLVLLQTLELYVFLSRYVAGYGMRLYPFLIIAFSSTSPLNVYHALYVNCNYMTF